MNCSFQGNLASSGGGVLYQDAPVSSQLVNCVLWNNGGSNSLQVYGGNATVSYSLLEPTVNGFTSGAGNKTAGSTPFASTTATQLAANSPAINAGNLASYTAVNGPATDLVGKARVMGSTIDMGALELVLPDLTPIIYARPTLVYGNSSFSVVVDGVELNSIPTNGVPTSATLTVSLTKDSRINLTFDSGLNQVNGWSVQNSGWNFDNTNPNYYFLTALQPVAAGDKLSFGLTGTLDAGATSGILTVSSVVMSKGIPEASLINNFDADKVDYFQQ